MVEVREMTIESATFSGLCETLIFFWNNRNYKVGPILRANNVFTVKIKSARG